MYMANAKILHWGPANFMFHVWGKANFSVFRYQHVGIHNAKFRVGNIAQREPLSRGILRQWNIGLRELTKNERKLT